MNTSYFAKYSGPNAVSIALWAPPGFKGRIYKDLAPKQWLLRKYKENGNTVFYKEQYQKEVLNMLDPAYVYNDLGEDSVLLCWERPEAFCHRHIVADWFLEKLGKTVTELTWKK